jgi:hypothetical protein
MHGPRQLEASTAKSVQPIRFMNDDQVKQFLRELKTIRLCVVVIAIVSILAFLAYFTNYH